jgi:hypothetical protein
MAGSSLCKYFSQTDRHGPLHWGRASADGIPFRGTIPLVREEEFEARVVRVPDFNNAFFDVTVPAENKQFNDVMERCVNGWFTLVFIERFWQQSTKHYVEWVEFYLEDGAQARAPNLMEGFSGGEQQNLSGYPG